MAETVDSIKNLILEIKETNALQKAALKVQQAGGAAVAGGRVAATKAKEVAKDQATYMKNLLGSFVGKNSYIGKSLTGIGNNLKTKIKGGIDTLWGLIKKGFFIAAIAGLIKFLESDTWEEWKKALVDKVPQLVEKTKKAFDKIQQVWEDLLPTLQDMTKKLGASLKRIFEAFFGAEGVGPRGYGAKQGSFIGGLSQIFTELFGKNNRVLWAFKQLGKLIGKFVDGLIDVITFVKGEDPEGNKIDRWQHFKDNWVELMTVLGGAFLFFKPFRFFKGLTVLGKLAWIGGKWTIFKPMKSAIGSLLRSLGMITAGIDESAAWATRAGMSSAFGAVKGASYALGGRKYTWMGNQFKDMTTGKMVGKNTQLALKLQSGISAGNISALDVPESSLIKAMKNHPRLSKAITKGVPVLGTLLSGYAAYSIMSNPESSREEKTKQLGGLLFGTLGASGLAALGGIIGTFTMGPGWGTLGGALLGGIGGYFIGEKMGYYLADFLMGGSPSFGSGGEYDVGSTVHPSGGSDIISSTLGSTFDRNRLAVGGYNKENRRKLENMLKQLVGIRKGGRYDPTKLDKLNLDISTLQAELGVNNGSNISKLSPSEIIGQSIRAAEYVNNIQNNIQNNRRDAVAAGFASPISNQDGYITALTWTGP